MCKNVYKGLLCLRWYLEGLIFSDVSEWTVVSSSQTVYGCTHQEYELYEIQLSGFRGVPLTRKTGLTDWLTDGRTDQIHYTFRNSLGGDIISFCNILLINTTWRNATIHWQLKLKRVVQLPFSLHLVD